MEENFYITTTLPYVNANPHIGFALEIIQADALARWKRERGAEVFFNTGADEHGLKIYRKAKEEGRDIQEYCDEYAQKFNSLKKALNLSYNSFIRTTDKNHIMAAQEFWRRCEKNGDIYKKNYKTKYCVGCETERTNSELVEGRCPYHPAQELEIIEEENYFFRYSKYRNKLLEIYEKNSEFILPKKRLKEIKEFTKRGLRDFSISRKKEKMPWGVPVSGDDSQVIYVWFDALVNYISCLGWPQETEKFNKFWPGTQVAGKDNLRHQTSMWQAMLLSAELPLSKQILIHGFITAGGKKMSKSLGNVVGPIEITEKYGADALRHFLLREIPAFEDGDFTMEKFEKRYNADLAKGLGNIAARILTMTGKKKVKRSGRGEIKNKKLAEEARKAREGRDKYMETFNFSKAIGEIWKLISFCDGFIEREKPWEEKDSSLETLLDLSLTLGVISDLVFPFLPKTSKKIRNFLRDPKKAETLFPKIT